ncbi:hypothetical protein IQ238_27600 [Pleurocapsales cyanobacterium LEGE 06147]|nr:hypothetical protein [Pleurocapsales cyanobacterium LEGE 06147]
MNPKMVLTDLPTALEIDVQTINPAPLARLEASRGANNPALYALDGGRSFH